MKTVHGTIKNLYHTVIVNAVESYNDLNKNSWLITNSSMSANFNDFGGFIVPYGIELNTKKPVLSINWNERPNNSDVLMISENGLCKVLYDSKVDSNSLLITESCNLGCIMCPQVSGHIQKDSELYNIALETINKIPVDCKWLCLTGGEPTLNWKNLISIIDICLNRLPKVKIQLLTNGACFNDSKYAEALASLASGRIICGIPLYSDNAIDHDNIVNKEGSFYKTVNGIFNLASYNIPIELRTVLIRQNSDRLIKWSRFIYSTMPFVYRVVLMGIELTGKAKDNEKDLWVEIRPVIDQISEVALFFNQADLDFRMYNFPLCSIPISLHKYAYRAISEWKRLYDKKCMSCTLNNNCGGFFFSSKEKFNNIVSPFNN